MHGRHKVHGAPEDDSNHAKNVIEFSFKRAKRLEPLSGEQLEHIMGKMYQEYFAKSRPGLRQEYDLASEVLKMVDNPNPKLKTRRGLRHILGRLLGRLLAS